MRYVLIAALLAAPGALASCGRKGEPTHQRKTHVLTFVPKLRGSIVVDTTGTDQAERLTMVVPVSGDSVARYYRVTLPANGWRIKSDHTDSTLTDIYAEGPQGGITGPSLWIHIEHQDTLSARYTLISTFPAAQRMADSASQHPAPPPAKRP